MVEEDIPDRDIVYLRIHRNSSPDGTINSAALRPQGEDGLSVDWAKYSTAEETQARARKPSANGVASVDVGGIRGIIYPGVTLEVEHDPIENNPEIPDNIAHSLIKGAPNELEENRLEIRKLMAKQMAWAIQVPLLE